MAKIAREVWAMNVNQTRKKKTKLTDSLEETFGHNAVKIHKNQVKWYSSQNEEETEE